VLLNLTFVNLHPTIKLTVMFPKITVLLMFYSFLVRIPNQPSFLIHKLRTVWNGAFEPHLHEHIVDEFVNLNKLHVLALHRAIPFLFLPLLYADLAEKSLAL